MTRALLVVLAIAFGATAPNPSAAQTFPSRLIRIVVPFPAGGPTDILARHIAQRLSAVLGQSVIIENEAGRILDKLPAGTSSEVIQKSLQEVVDRNIKNTYRVNPGLFQFEKDVPAAIIGDYKDARSIRIPLSDIPVERQNTLKGALKSSGMPVTHVWRGTGTAHVRWSILAPPKLS